MSRSSGLACLLGCALVSTLACGGAQKPGPRPASGRAPAASTESAGDARAAAGCEVNADGRDLIDRGRQASRDDLSGRPLVEDRTFQTYLETLAGGLVPRGKALPEGVRITVSVIESRRPELYSYVNGTIVVATGAVMAADDEAQLAALLSHEVAHLAEDDFEVTSKLESGGATAMPGMGSIEGATRQTYTLDEVRKGLAYFTVKQRATVKAAGVSMNDAGKGSAVFDLKDGMWLELETRSVSKAEEGLGAGTTVAQITKSTFERR